MKAAKRIVTALLDKAGPPDHSFVSGMLANTIARNAPNVVFLVVSKEQWTQRVKPFRYHGAICIPALLPRKHIGRLLNYIAARLVVRRIAKRAVRSGATRNSVLVRNDPMLLLGAAHEKRRFDRLVFQSSFPHEVVATGAKRTIALWCFSQSSRYVDALLAVSPLGLLRVRRLFPEVSDGGYIPLLADHIVENNPAAERRDGPVKFIYSGSHDPERQLDVVLRAIADANLPPSAAQFTFLGGADPMVDALRREVSDVARLESTGAIRFVTAVPRDSVFGILLDHDVGLSLIPPLSIYKEASPTKLAEYMASGLAVIVSNGIAMQEDWVNASQCGIVVGFNPEDIAKTLKDTADDPQKIISMKYLAWKYATDRLSYEMYRSDLEKWLWQG